MELSDINPYIRTVGYFRWNYHDTVPRACYDFRVFAVLEHCAYLFLRNKKLLLKPHSVVILAPGEPYRFINETDGTPFRMYCLSFDLTQEYRDDTCFLPPTYLPQFRAGEIVDRKLCSGERDISGLSLPLIGENCVRECRLVTEIYEMFQNQELYYPERCSGIMKEILFGILAADRFRDNGEDDVPDSCRGAAVARDTMQYIRTHFREPLDEKRIAAVMKFHPYYLTRLTMRYYHTSPYRYLIRCRVEEAVRLLTETDASVSEIADACGFANPSHFSAVLRRCTGLSPRALRKNAGSPVLTRDI